MIEITFLIQCDEFKIENCIQEQLVHKLQRKSSGGGGDGDGGGGGGDDDDDGGPLCPRKL